MDGSFFKMIFNLRLSLGVTELSKVTHVSPSQLRYWERKGYIKSEQDQENKNHHFNVLTMLRVSTIKYYLDQGYTLKAAIQKEKEHRQSTNLFRIFLLQRIQKMKQLDSRTGEIDLGELDDDPTKEVYAVIKSNGHTELHLRPRKDYSSKS